MSFAFGPRSEQRLDGVHPDLVRVVRRALELSAVDFSVAEGLRTLERQRELFAKKLSKTMNSRHLTGHAVDLYPVTRLAEDWTPADFAPIVKAMRTAAQELGIPVVHGADWGWDHPHHELDRKAYP